MYTEPDARRGVAYFPWGSIFDYPDMTRLSQSESPVSGRYSHATSAAPDIVHHQHIALQMHHERSRLISSSFLGTGHVVLPCSISRSADCPARPVLRKDQCMVTARGEMNILSMFVPPKSAGSLPCCSSWTFLWTRRTPRWNVGLARSCRCYQPWDFDSINLWNGVVVGVL